MITAVEVAFVILNQIPTGMLHDKVTKILSIMPCLVKNAKPADARTTIN